MNRPFENRIAATVVSIGLGLAALAPIFPRPAALPPGTAQEPAWPGRIDGCDVWELPLSDAEQRFAADFPGRIKRFTDGRRVIILRWVPSATRKLHPSADCFRGLGYAVHEDGTVTDAEGRRWGSFSATRGDMALQITERIHDSGGNSWTDVSSWFWAAMLGRSAGPWWAVTEVR